MDANPGWPPAMIPIGVARDNSRADELKQYRSYLIERGAVACMSQLYMFMIEKFSRNEECGAEEVRTFLATFRDESNPHAAEIQTLEGENEGLREVCAELTAKVAGLEDEVRNTKRRNVAKKLWKALVPDASEEFTTGKKIWLAFCGSQPDKNTEVSPGIRTLPEYCRVESEEPNLGHPQAIRRAAFLRFAAVELDTELLDWCETLLPRFAEAKGEAPFQEDLLDAFACASAYPVSPDPDRTMAAYVRGMAGDPNDSTSERGKATELFDRDIKASIAEVTAPVAFPAELPDFMRALLAKFGACGNPPPLTEEEEEELNSWNL